MDLARTLLIACTALAMQLSLLAGQGFAQEQQDAVSNEPPVIPIGLDAYRMWDRLHLQRIGERAYMVSTYMREGGNREADSRNFIWMGEQENVNVTLDVIGPGVLYFKRTNHWHGSPWHYIVDGTTYMVEETGAEAVTRRQARATMEEASFIPAASFPEPLVYTWATTKGADLMWVPIGFEESFRLAYSRTFYGTGYYIFKRYANDEYLSQPIRAWTINDVPDEDVLELLNRSGSDIAPTDIATVRGEVRLDEPRKIVADIRDQGASVVRAFKVILPIDQALELERLRLQVTWDDRPHPSIDAPLALFFGTGTLYNRDEKEHLVKGFPINVRFDYDAGQVELACYYPMPFFRSARVELSGITPSSTSIAYEIRYEPFDGAPNQSAYFHATYKDFPDPEMGRDLVLLDTRGEQGHDEWSGSFVGTTYIFTKRNFLGTLEGDPRFFFDGARSPQAHGTGSEEWGGGGDYWGGQTMTIPLAGHPVGAPRGTDADDVPEIDLLHSAYRFLLADIMPFGNRAVIHLEHGGWNKSVEHYETVTYWYGLPAPSLVKTGEINIGNTASEQNHHYVSPHASEVEEIYSRYDGWGVDTIPADTWARHRDTRDIEPRYVGREVIPVTRETGRYTRGASEFSVHIEQNNHGVMLRRTLDWSFPNQKARVYIADASEAFNPQEPQWEEAGIWYTPGSNTYVYTPTRRELDDRSPTMITSNRRFRDDEFLIPARLTRDRSAIRVRVEHVPVERELFPGQPFPRRSAWSELRYEVYSYIMPRFTLDD